MTVVTNRVFPQQFTLGSEEPCHSPTAQGALLSKFLSYAFGERSEPPTHWSSALWNKFKTSSGRITWPLQTSFPLRGCLNHLVFWTSLLFTICLPGEAGRCHLGRQGLTSIHHVLHCKSATQSGGGSNSCLKCCPESNVNNQHEPISGTCFGSDTVLPGWVGAQSCSNNSK